MIDWLSPQNNFRKLGVIFGANYRPNPCGPTISTHLSPIVFCTHYFWCIILWCEQIFDGNLTLGDEQALFQRARLFISPHGALLANIFFMPRYGEVLEIRPNKFDNGVYHFVAHICGVRYNLLYGNGTKDTHIIIDHNVVIDMVRMIVKDFPLDQKIDPDSSLLAKESDREKGEHSKREDGTIIVDVVPKVNIEKKQKSE